MMLSPLTVDIARVAAEHQLEPELVHAVVLIESGENPWAWNLGCSRSPRCFSGAMADLASTTAVAFHRRVQIVERMAVTAMCLSRVDGGASNPTKHVRSASDQFDMGVVDAASNSTEVIRIQAGGDRSVHLFPSDSVRANVSNLGAHDPLWVKDCVPIPVDAAGPQPAWAEVWPECGQWPVLIDPAPECNDLIVRTLIRASEGAETLGPRSSWAELGSAVFAGSRHGAD